jgi:glycine/D-amino acid oxidase-like deaminating enzyme
MTEGTRRGRGRRGRLRVVVVGAGVTGLLAAIRCVQDGHRVVLLERGPVPHPGGTSYDQHRALRALVAGDVAATSRAARLYRYWCELDALLRDDLSGALYRRVGVLTALPPDRVASAVATAQAARLPIRIADPADYPHIGFPTDALVVFEPQAGVLLADRVLHAAARWLHHHPLADLRPGQEVVGVRPDVSQVVLADGTAESGDVVLVAAGPWSAALMGLPVTLYCQTMVYLRPPAEFMHRWAVTPVAGGIGVDGEAWLIPPVAGTLLKISTDAVRREVSALSDPAELSDPADHSGWAARVLSADIVSTIDRYGVVRVRHCHYATAADGETGFVRVGPAVWVRPASGGDGFRTAPQVVDTVLGEMIDVGRFVGAATSSP